jgi:hypothetical protein
MEVAIVGVALNHAFDTRPIHPSTKRQDIACLRSNHQMLIIDRAFDTPRLVWPLEVARDHIPLLLQFKKLRRRAPIRIFTIQSPLTRNAGRLLLRRRLLREQKTAAENHQSETKRKNPQAISLHHILLAAQWHSKISSNPLTLTFFYICDNKCQDKILVESQYRIAALQPPPVHRKEASRLCRTQQIDLSAAR